MTAYEERVQRTKEFLSNRFGMFIHWGLYAIPARGEWVRSNEKISVAEYQQFFDEFNPVRYNPKAWVRLAKEAGMKYAVMTTKHHDGFCLFDSKYTDYKATNTKAGRDLIREYVEAFRAEGLKVGFYYSIIDWRHPDYPHFGDRFHPMRENAEYKDKKHDFNRYLEYMHNQVRELMTNYGKIDIMWFDFSYDDMTGEKWRATELVNMVRSLQPGIVIDNRLGGDMLGENPEVYSGDFASPEQYIPAEGIQDALGRDVPWEACVTLNDHWGYAAEDNNYKSAENVIRLLVECVSKGGNMLINVGPDAKGEIPAKSVEILKKAGDWMRVNGESIYGCGKAGFAKPERGRYTQRGNMLYMHIYERGLGPIRLDGTGGRVKKARLLSDGSELRIFRMRDSLGNEVGDTFIVLPWANLPDEADTVVEVELS
ncbi:MAG TPA: alpha-L-fucosidase [Clostridia bacterium]|nr:alpha-L-fucosidase [Clostridia bacterium]